MRHTWVVAALLAGCASAGSFRPATSREVDPASGNLIALRVDYGEGRTSNPIILQVPYAFLIHWDESPRRRTLSLYDNECKRIFVTRSWQAFLAALREWPVGVEVATFNTCGGPFHQGLSEERWTEMESAMQKRGIRWKSLSNEEIDFLVICTCESVGLDLPLPRNHD